MKKLVAALVLLVAVFVPSVASATPGGPIETLRSDQRPCVTEQEFGRVYMHWNERQVQRWFDVAGERLKGKPRDGRWSLVYPVCDFESTSCDGEHLTAGVVRVVYDRLSAVRADLTMIYDCSQVAMRTTSRQR